MTARCTLQDVATASGAVLQDGIGSTDCETLRDAALAQPVNTVTSLAYVVVGVWVAATAYRRGRLDATAIVFALCLAGIGIGSVLFHGPQPAGSRLLHDLPITLTVVFIIVHDVWLLRGRDRALTAFAPLAVAVTALAIISVDLATAATAVGAAVVAGLEFVIARRRARSITNEGQRRAYAVIIGVSALGAISYVLGRTGSPTCDPDSPLQFHAVWHLLSATVFAAWWWLAFDLPRQRPDTAGTLRGSTLIDQG